MNPKRAKNPSVPRLSKSEARQKRQEEKIKSSLRPPLIARNPRQAAYLKALNNLDQVFAIGPEGTAKTYIAARWGIRQVLDGRKERLILSRPTVSKPKHRLGFRPGGQDDKVVDWLIPILDAVKDECGMATIERMKNTGLITYAAFETMMGRTFRDAVMLLDEAQNCDFKDLRLFITRQGDNSQIIINGSLEQVDAIPDSGLEQIIDMVGKYGIDAAVIRFTDDDVVRSKAVAQWVKAFRQETSQEDITDGLTTMLTNSAPILNGRLLIGSNEKLNGSGLFS